VISRSPYPNHSHIVVVVHVSWEEYILYCSCVGAGSRWKTTEVLACEVCKLAYERGYGTSEEIIPVSQESQDAWPIGGSASQQLDCERAAIALCQNCSCPRL
jgi:hypothetical protein